MSGEAGLTRTRAGHLPAHQKVQPPVPEAPGEAHADTWQPLIGSAGLAGGDLLVVQASHIGSRRLHVVQREALAERIGQTQGNYHLQRVIVSATHEKEAAPYQLNNNRQPAQQAPGPSHDAVPSQVQRRVAAPAAESGKQAPEPELSWWERGKRWAFKKVLGAAGVDEKQVMGLIGRAGNALMEIILHPGRFVGSLVKAIGQGFRQFRANIQQHLVAGLMGWIFGAVAKAGIALPKDFSLKSILGLVLQVLGLTVERIKAKVVQVVGSENVRRIEQVWQVFSKFLGEGLGGLWEMLKGYLGDLKEIVIAGVKSWLITEIIQAAVVKVVSMFNPVTGLIAIVKMIYNVIKFLIEQARNIAALFGAIAGSVVDLAMGNFKAAADKVEQALARLIPIVIGFLASLLGISGIAERVKGIIKGIQARVEKAIDFVIGGVAKGLKKIGGKVLDKIKGGVKWAKGKVEQGKEWVKGKVERGKNWFSSKFGQKRMHEESFTALNEQHSYWLEVSGNGLEVMVASGSPQTVEQLLEHLESLIPRLEKRGGLVSPEFRARENIQKIRKILVRLPKKFYKEASPTILETRNNPEYSKIGEHLNRLLTIFGNLHISRHEALESKMQSHIEIEFENLSTSPSGEEDRIVDREYTQKYPQNKRTAGVTLGSATKSNTTMTSIWQSTGGRQGKHDSHAERHFLDEYRLDKAEFWSKVVRIRIHNKPLSPCSLCAADLTKLLNTYSNIKSAVLFWEEPYKTGIHATKPEDLVAMEKAGWVIHPSPSQVDRI